MSIKKLTINQMTSIAQLKEASEYTKFSLNDLVNRAREIAQSEKEYIEFANFCKGYEPTIKAGSWGIAPPTVRS